MALHDWRERESKFQIHAANAACHRVPEVQSVKLARLVYIDANVTALVRLVVDCAAAPNGDIAVYSFDATGRKRRDIDAGLLDHNLLRLSVTDEARRKQ